MRQAGPGRTWFVERCGTVRRHVNLMGIGSERLPRQTPNATVANVKEPSYLVVWIGFEFSDDFDDEGGGDCREDTSLMP